MKKSALFLSTLLVLLASFTARADFSDVDDSDPYAKAIHYVQSKGVVTGYADGTYKAESTIIRAEFLAIVVRALFDQSEIDACQNIAFDDVPLGQWYSGPICLAKQKEIVEGYPDGTFKLENEISFVEAAKIIAIAFGKSTGDQPNPWYLPFVKGLAASNSIPLEINAFDKPITRGEMAEMIYRIHGKVTDKPSQSYASLSGETLISCHDGHCDEINKSTGAVVKTAEMHAEGSVTVAPTIETGFCIDEGCNEITITTDESYMYFTVNNIPNHETGDFPNSGNPNTIQEQSNQYRITLNPVKTDVATPVQMPGLALNGVFYEPGTAERNGEWSYEALQEELNLGLDMNNAHVQPDGSYHYHGIPEGLIETLDAAGDVIQVGWASDGFPMLYSVSDAYQSSYRLKAGTRPTSPYGEHDGTYTQDFEYVEGLGDLDKCNGKEVDGVYGYFITDDFPYITRCVFGTPDESFNKSPGAGAGPTGGNMPPMEGDQQNPMMPGMPPQEAIDACVSKTAGDSCSFEDQNGSHTGTCGETPEGMACKPN